MPVYENSLAKVPKAPEWEHPIISFIKSIEDPKERINAISTVLEHCGKEQYYENWDMQMEDFYQKENPTLEDAAEKSMSLFLEGEAKSRVELDRARLIDDRFCSFETVHYCYPYVGYGTREYEIPGYCVADLRLGRTYTRMTEAGVGDDTTLVYAGKSGVDEVRIKKMHDGLLPLMQKDEALVSRAMVQVESMRTLDMWTPRREFTSESLRESLTERLSKVLDQGADINAVVDVVFDAMVSSDRRLGALLGSADSQQHRSAQEGLVRETAAQRDARRAALKEKDQRQFAESMKRAGSVSEGEMQGPKIK